MYLSPEARGQGLGQALLEALLKKAKELDFTACYLESTENLKDALRLYEKNDFVQLKYPMGDTGHHACEIPMALKKIP